MMHRARFAALVVSAAAVVACRPTTSEVPAPGEPASPRVESDDAELESALAEAVAGVRDPAVAELLRRHWSDTLRHEPIYATQLGVHAWDHELADPTLEGEARARKRRDAYLEQALAIEASALNEADALTLAIFIDQQRSSQRRDVCAFSTWSLSARGGPLGTLNRLPRVHRIDDERDAQNFLARVAEVPRHFDVARERLAVGLAAGRVANVEAARRVVEMLDRQLAAPTSQWAVMELSLPEGWEASEQAQVTAKVAALVDEKVRPAAKAYAEYLRTQILPSARGDDKAGLVALPDGEACYAALIERYTTLPMSAQEIHDLGLSEMKRINAEMQALGEKLFGTRDLPEILRRLREDPKLHFSSAQEVEDFARAALADAKAAMPKAFGRLPKADCVVTPIPDYEAPFTTIAYYDEPHADGSKPGEYFVNTYAPETRPRYEARVLAYHESIPGHHLQIAIAQELEAVPAFRRYGGQTVFVEGWGLYSERLSDEMGLYPEDLDRMGVLSFDAWRAGRLVVDTGIHAMGWSRQQAVDYLVAHTALATNNIDNEVDRYITTPGQALAYKIGQLEFLALRERAKAALGEGFRLADFHDVVLSGGALSIPRLRDRVQAWLDGAK